MKQLHTNFKELAELNVDVTASIKKLRAELVNEGIVCISRTIH